MTISRSEKVFLALLPALLLFTRVLADVTVLLVVLAFLWHCYQQRDWQWASSRWFAPVWLFWFYLLAVNLPLSHDSQDSLLYVITFIRWPLFAVAIGLWVLRDELRQRWFLWALLLTSVFIIADTVWQYFFGSDWFGIAQLSPDRLTGPFRNQIPGTMMLRVWFIMGFAALLLPMLQQPKRQFIALFILMLSGLAFIFITGERMAFLAFSAGCLLTLTAMWLHFQAQRKEMLVGLALLIVVFSLVVMSDPAMLQRTILSIFVKLENFYQSDYGMVFRAAWAAWQQAPIVGNGMHSYHAICEQQGVLNTLSQGTMQCSHPHNLYLHLLAETGLVGLLLYVLMLATLYVHILLPLLRQHAWLIATLCFTIMTVSFFPLIGGKSVFNNWVASLVWLGVGWCLAISLRSQIKPEQP